MYDIEITIKHTFLKIGINLLEFQLETFLQTQVRGIQGPCVLKTMSSIKNKIFGFRGIL